MFLSRYPLTKPTIGNVIREEKVNLSTLAILMAVVLAGCGGAAVPINSESGRPEVTIQGASVERVKSALVNKMCFGVE